MSGYKGVLASIGYRDDTPTLDDLMVDQRAQLEFKAFCQSAKCNGNRSGMGSQKKVTRDAVDCPDCGYALFWTQMSGAKPEVLKRRREQRSRAREGAIDHPE
jgi:hypothetical protein